ncbi:MAG: hypothetical protein N2445_05705, partial [Acidobacteria bacterium]|nr:hypothetical protein [Acidobacteriota bacterium]
VGSNGGLVFCGDSKSFSGGNQYAWIVKLDEYGNIEWQKTYNKLDESFNWIEKTSDNGYIVIGKRILVKIDSIGTIQWKKEMTFAQTQTFYSVKQTADGGYIIFGTAGVNNTVPPPIGYIIAKISSDGNLTWVKVYGGSDDTSAGEIVQTFDGGYVFVGTSLNLQYKNQADIFKLDYQGNFVWRRSFSATSMGDRYFYCIKEDSATSSLYALGRHYSLPSSLCWLVKLDFNGNVGFKKAYTYGGWSSKSFFDSISTNGIFALKADYDVYKVDANGLIENCSYIIDTNNENVVSTSLSPRDPVSCIYQDFSLQTSDTSAVIIDLSVSQNIICGTDCQPPSNPVINEIVDNDPLLNNGVSIYYTAGAPSTRHDLYRNGSLVKSNFLSGETYSEGECNIEYDYTIVSINNSTLCYSTSMPVKGKDGCLLAPGEVADGEKMTFVADQSSQQINWVADSVSSGYRVYRGLLTNLQGLCDNSQDFCTVYDGTFNAFDITNEQPELLDPLNRVLFYLITGYNSVGEGTAGSGNCGERIINSSGGC